MPAQGQSLETHHSSFRGTTSLFGMQQGQTGTDPGAWVDIRSVKTGSLEFAMDGPSGTITAFSAQVMISNAQQCPANATDGSNAGSAVTTLGVIALPMTGRWMKVKVTSLTVTGAGSLGVRLHAHNY